MELSCSDNFLPQFATPPSDMSDHGHTNPTLEDNFLRKSCENCRALKVKCEVSKKDKLKTAPTCQRCAKNEQQCRFAGRTQRRRKRSDVRLAELEKKIELITASERRGSISLSTPNENSLNNGEPERARKRVRFSNDAVHEKFPESIPPQQLEGSGNTNLIQMANTILEASASSQASTELNEKPSFNFDAITKGILSMKSATDLYNHYNMEMIHHFPAVICPPGLTASACRTEKPMLFLAIITAAAITAFPSIDVALQNLLYSAFAEKIIQHGEKSLELIQALLISCIWYFHTHNIGRSRGYMFQNLASTMAIELGLANLATLYKPNPGFVKSVEARRTLLACYWVGAYVGLLLRGPLFLKWTSYMKECLDVLETSKEVASTDRLFVEFIRAIQMTDEVMCAVRPHLAEAGSTGAARDVEFALAVMGKKLLEPKERILKLGNPSLSMFYYSTQLQIYAIVLRVDRPYLSTLTNLNPEQTLQSPLTTAQVGAYGKCVEAVHSLLGTFLSLSPETIRAGHVPAVLGVIHASSWLLQLFTILKQSGTAEEENEVEKLRVPYYLESVERKMKEALVGCRCKTLAMPSLIMGSMRQFVEDKFEPRFSDVETQSNQARSVVPAANDTVNTGWSENPQVQVPDIPITGSTDYWTFPLELPDEQFLTDMGISSDEVSDFALGMENWMMLDGGYRVM